MQRFMMAAGALVCLTVSSFAETVGAPGEAVTLRVERPEGRFEMKVTPPADQAVDKRILDWLMDRDDGVGILASDDDPIDLSDYRIKIDYRGGTKTTSAANCHATIKLKAKPINLGPDKGWIFETDSAMHMSIAAFPTKGDVAMAIFAGPSADETCAFSNKGKATLDAISCTISDCQNNGVSEFMGGIVGNVTSSSATYVGVHNLVYATIP